MARRYGKGAQKEVAKEMRRFKKGTAHSGIKDKEVESPEQAIAIGLSIARKKGIKVPRAPKKATTKKKTVAKKATKARPAKRKTVVKSKAKRTTARSKRTTTKK